MIFEILINIIMIDFILLCIILTCHLPIHYLYHVRQLCLKVKIKTLKCVVFFSLMRQCAGNFCQSALLHTYKIMHAATKLNVCLL